MGRECAEFERDNVGVALMNLVKVMIDIRFGYTHAMISSSAPRSILGIRGGREEKCSYLDRYNDKLTLLVRLKLHFTQLNSLY